MDKINQEIFSLDDIYFKDAFTKTEDKLNLEIDSANIGCVTSKHNNFSLDSEGNLIVNSLTANSINIQNFFDAMYPIGSIYININETNPSTLFGGVWEPIKDTFLLGTGDKYVAGTIGGEAEHILTLEETPSHKHGLRRTDGGVLAGAWDTVANGNNTGFFSTMGKNRYASYETTNVGGSQSHNNMPPYLTVYMWKRVS